MKFITRNIICIFIIASILFSHNSFATNCSYNQIKYNNICIDAQFILTTTSTNNFGFIISAAGNFTVDCGMNGTLIGPGVSDNIHITREKITPELYTCSWTDTGTHDIRFSGLATGYNNGTYTWENYYSEPPYAAIGFNTSFTYTDSNAEKIHNIAGSLGAIFPTLEKPSFGIGQPRFRYTFWNCKNLVGPLPENLFTGIYGEPVSNMFHYTFGKCHNLGGTIPKKLFADITGAPQTALFDNTFRECYKLSGYVPSKLFAGISKSTTAKNQMTNMFLDSGLDTSCPENTYRYTTGFESYFSGKVACNVCPNGGTSPAGSTNVNQCIAPPCPENYYIPPNHPELCFPYVLHFSTENSDDVIYLKNTAITPPVLNIDLNNDLVADAFAKITTVPTYMNDTSKHYFKIMINNIEYYVCDDTTCPATD